MTQSVMRLTCDLFVLGTAAVHKLSYSRGCDAVRDATDL